LHPFQARLVVGQATNWWTPAPVDSQRFAVANRQGDLYLVGIEEAGAPHLAARQQATAKLAPVAAPVCDGRSIFLVGRGGRHDVLQQFTVPELQASQETGLPGRLRWGPFLVNDTLLLSTLPGGLQVFAGEGRRLWSRELHGALPVGAPAATGDDFVLTTTTGQVMRWHLRDGKLVDHRDVGEPLSDGPAVLEDRIALRAADGSVLFIAHP